MERAEIAELFYDTLIGCDEVEQLFRFLSPRVEWILSATDPQTLGEESPQNAIKFLGRQGLRQLAIYFRDSLKAISGDLICCFNHHNLVFVFGRALLRSPASALS